MNLEDKNIVSEAETLKSAHTSGESVLQVSEGPRRSRTVISKSWDCFIEVLHRDSDPSTWIVRRWKKILWFKKRISSDWFINRQQAYAYAEEMSKNNRRHNS
jgi:hypothetical protein